MEKLLKILIAFSLAIFYRLIPVRPPNVEPLLAILMPFSRKWNPLELFFFSFLSIFIYDFFTAGIGSHTWGAGLCYGFLGVASNYYFKKNSFSRKNYATFSIASILAFDAVTGLIITPLSGTITFTQAIVGQIPFTALHLMGGVLFAIILSPLIEKYLVNKEFKIFDSLPKESREATHI